MLMFLRCDSETLFTVLGTVEPDALLRIYLGYWPIDGGYFAQQLHYPLNLSLTLPLAHWFSTTF